MSPFPRAALGALRSVRSSPGPAACERTGLLLLLACVLAVRGGGLPAAVFVVSAAAASLRAPASPGRLVAPPHAAG